jgi:hypothetical protein
MATKPGLYANIHAKQKRIAEDSGEKMRKPGTKGAPTKAEFNHEDVVKFCRAVAFKELEIG